MKIRNVPISTLILGIVAAGCGSAAIYLGAELSSAHEELDREAQARSAVEARLRQLEDEHRSREVEWPAARPAAGPAGPPPTASGPRVADNVKAPGVAPASPRADLPGNVYSTPAGQNSRRLQQEIRLRRTYSDMPTALGLDAAQADKLFDLLADNQLATADAARAYNGDPAGRQAIEAEGREQRNAQIDALLGPDKAAEFQSFEKSIPARMQVNRIGEGMAAANVPLSDAQRNSLIAVVVSEQDSGPPPKRPENGANDSDYQARFLDWQADYSRRVQARVEPLLTPEQVTRYREAVQVQNARRAEQRARAARQE